MPELILLSTWLMQQVKIRIVRSAVGPNEIYRAGDVLTLPFDKVRSLIRAGIAEAIPEVEQRETAVKKANTDDWKGYGRRK